MHTQWKAKVLIDDHAILGEGPLWDVTRQALWWVDTKRHKLNCFSPSDGSNKSFDVGQQIGTVVLREKGGLVVGLEHGIGIFDPETGDFEILCDPESHLHENRFNDGKCDPAGRLWIGSMENAEENMDRGALYCFDIDGRVKKQVAPVGVSNGIAWTSDATTMYYIDSPTRRVDRFDYDVGTGEISNRRTAFEIPDGMGFPDGMAIDVEDKLWVALWNGWAVGRFDPETGELLGKVDVDASHVSACSFGGPELDELFITTARHLLEKHEDEAQPHAGGLFHTPVGVRGVPFGAYGG